MRDFGIRNRCLQGSWSKTWCKWIGPFFASFLQLFAILCYAIKGFLTDMCSANLALFCSYRIRENRKMKIRYHNQIEKLKILISLQEMRMNNKFSISIVKHIPRGLQKESSSGCRIPSSRHSVTMAVKLFTEKFTRQSVNLKHWTSKLVIWEILIS